MQELILEGVLKLSVGLQDDRKRRADKTVDCPIKTTVKLAKGSECIEFRTEFENRARDHRLRVLFPCGVLASASMAESQFAAVSRAIDRPDVGCWEEEPPVTHPQKGFADVSDERFGVAVFNRGLPEYEALNADGQSWIALTLLRSVGWLSRGDLLTRNGNGGWPIETPDAQCLGLQCFEYVYMPHGGHMDVTGIAIRSDSFNTPVESIQPRGFSGEKADRGSFITAMPSQWRISAMKRADDGDGVIVRFFNIAGTAVSGRLVFGFSVASAEETTLDERFSARLDVSENTVTLALRQGEIKTLRIRRGENTDFR
jgi:alpha-mannosidase